MEVVCCAWHLSTADGQRPPPGPNGPWPGCFPHPTRGFNWRHGLVVRAHWGEPDRKNTRLDRLPTFVLLALVSTSVCCG